MKNNLTPYQKVRTFHKKFKMYIGNNPQNIPDKEYELGINLIIEEYAELLEAVECGCMIEILDAIADSIFVLYGMLVRLGIDGDKLFDVVWKANMKKDGGSYNKNGKLLKPKGWIPPQKEIEKMLEHENEK